MAGASPEPPMIEPLLPMTSPPRQESCTERRGRQGQLFRFGAFHCVRRRHCSLYRRTKAPRRQRLFVWFAPRNVRRESATTDSRVRHLGGLRRGQLSTALWCTAIGQRCGRMQGNVASQEPAFRAGKDSAVCGARAVAAGLRKRNIVAFTKMVTSDAASVAWYTSVVIRPACRDT
jgi:hypothetical protein